MAVSMLNRSLCRAAAIKALHGSERRGRTRCCIGHGHKTVGFYCNAVLANSSGVDTFEERLAEQLHCVDGGGWCTLWMRVDSVANCNHNMVVTGQN